MAIVTLPHPRRTALHVVALVACAGLLWYQLRDVEFAHLFADVRPMWVLAAVGGFLVSLAAAAHNISAFAPLRLRAIDSLRAQLAMGGMRLIAPSAVSTPAIGTRFLMRSGLPGPTAVTVLAVAQAAQLLMTVLLVGAVAGTASTDLPVPDRTAGYVGLGAAVALASAVLLARTVPRVRQAVAATLVSIRSVGRHLREHPLRVLSGLGASAVLTVAHIAAFACCVHAVGGDASLLALTAIYLGAASAGSVVPTPGGIGAVESAMISSLIATGLPPQTATAAALLARLVTVWLPALPGLFALRGLRRDGLL